jgi:hypothetical protein
VLALMAAAWPAAAQAEPPLELELTRPAAAKAEGEITVPPHEPLWYTSVFKDTFENPVGAEGCEGNPVKCEATVEWSFGDGTSAVTDHAEASECFAATECDSAEVSTQHEYANEGTYQLTLKVSVKAGGEASAHFTVHVKPTLLTTLTANAEFPVVGQPVTFTSEQLASKEVTSPVSYELSINPGGLVEYPATLEATSPWKATFQHAFAEPGAYSVLVRAHDSSSPEHKAGSAERTVEVLPKLGGTAYSETSEPEADQEDFLLAEPTGGKPPYSYAWSADGTPFGGSEQRVRAPFSGQVGHHSFAVTVSDSAKPVHTETFEGQVNVLPTAPALSASVTPSGTVAVGESGEVAVPFEAHVSGGVAPYFYNWRIEWGLEPGPQPWERTAAPVFTRSFNFHVESVEPRRVTLEVTDSRGHRALVEDVVSFQTCQYSAEVGLVQIVSQRCLKLGKGEEGATTWSTEGEVKVNGLPIQPARGHPLVLTAPTKAHPGGRIGAGGLNLALKFPGLEITLLHEATLSWDLPSGRSHEEALATMSVSPGTSDKLFGMNVGGAVHVNAGVDSKGEHYLAFALNVELPSLFKSGPDKQAGGVTAEAAMRLDLRGYHFDGLHFELKEAWIGALQVEDICLAYVPAGSEQPVSDCPPPEVEGKPFIECNESASYSRWSGAAALVLPTGTKSKLAIFGGLSNGSVSYFGGILEAKPGLPIVDDVYLDRVGVGICLQPPPLKLKGEVGVNALPVAGKPTLQVNGHFLFTNSYTDESGEYHPWSIELGGSVDVYEQQVGHGFVTVDGNGDLEFGLFAELHLFKIVTVEGGVEGWVEPRQKLFNIAGNVEACIWSECAGASGVISSTGVAGCLHLEILGIPASAGFGHRWDEGSRVQLLGSSCDFGPFEATRSALIAAAGRSGQISIAPRTRAIVVRVASIGAPPQVVLSGPHGTQITTPATGAARGYDYLAVANPTDDSTDILLVRPAAGRWRLRPANPSTRVTSITTSRFLGSASGHGRVLNGRHGTRLLIARLHLPPGEHLTLGEKGAGVARTLHLAARPHPCGRGGRPSAHCIRLAFHPAPGRAGEREIIAVVSRGGMPVSSFVLARFHASAPPLPARPRLRLERRGSGVLVAWSHSPGASRYTISLATGGGKQVGFSPTARCQRIVVPGIGKGTKVSVKVAGVRYDLAVGPYSRATLRPHQRHAGSKRRPGGALCR